MRRILVMLVVTALLAAALASAAFAAANPNADCKGEFLSNQRPGTKGQLMSAEARERGGIGEPFDQGRRSCNANANPHGGARAEAASLGLTVRAP